MNDLVFYIVFIVLAVISIYSLISLILNEYEIYKNNKLKKEVINYCNICIENEDKVDLIAVLTTIIFILKDFKIMKLEEQIKNKQITARYGYTGYGKDYYYEKHHKGEDKK